MAGTWFINRGIAYHYRRRYRRIRSNRRRIGRLMAVQHLLRSKGMFISIRTLRSVSRQQIRHFIRNHFTPEEVAHYLPPHLIFTSQEIQDSQISLTEGELGNTASSTRSKQNLYALTAVPDINEPIAPTQEIASPEGVYLNEQIFNMSDVDYSFDPGLWLSMPQSLPQGYSIPDPRFTSVLQAAQSKFLS